MSPRDSKATCSNCRTLCPGNKDPDFVATPSSQLRLVWKSYVHFLVPLHPNRRVMLCPLGNLLSRCVLWGSPVYSMRKERDVGLRCLSLNGFYPYLYGILKYIRVSLKNFHGLIFFFVCSCFLHLVIDCRCSSIVTVRHAQAKWTYLLLHSPLPTLYVLFSLVLLSLNSKVSVFSYSCWKVTQPFNQLLALPLKLVSAIFYLTHNFYIKDGFNLKINPRLFFPLCITNSLWY